MPWLLLSALAAGAAEPAEPADQVLNELDYGFYALRLGQHAKARTLLGRAVATFNDLALDGSALEKAFASDANKPYRGRPHERVLASAVLAALDMERGRCDLALPALKNAAFLDAKTSPHDISDAVLVHALALRCLVKGAHADAPAEADVERARADLRAAAGASYDAVARAALADDLVLALDGDGPTFVPSGHDEETVTMHPSPTPAGESVVMAGADDDASAIRLGAHASTAPPLRGLVAWSSTFQASTVQGRPFDAVLKDRARFKDRALADGPSLVKRGAATAAKLTARDAVTGILAAGAGAGLTAAGAFTDARADERYVDELFERALLVTSSE